GTIKAQLEWRQTNGKTFDSVSKQLLSKHKGNREFSRKTPIDYNEYDEQGLKQPYNDSFLQWHDNYGQLVNDNIKLNELEKEVINVHYYTSKINIFKKYDRLKSSKVFNKIMYKKMFLLFILPVIILLVGFSFLHYGMNATEILYYIPFAVSSFFILFYTFFKILKYYIYIENDGKCSFGDYFRIFSKKIN
ncbi:hypothetical protein PCYB_033050, partial [Plasmodium cynomolgi strain B]